MNDLIKALQIFAKYTDTKYPTHCEHDIMMIMDIEQNEITVEDELVLGKLGFIWSDEYDCFISFRFGSA
jgi:hypothetical protein